MKIQVGLLDESEIIKKMLSHCLHYFVVNIHAFKNWDQCLLHANNEKLNILFVDWDMSHGDTRLINLVRDQIDSVPSVLMHRQDASAEISKLDPALIPHKIIKPLNPNQVRDIFAKLVPQANESSIHAFLRFPKSPSSDPTPSDPSLKEAKQTAPSLTTPLAPAPNPMTSIQNQPDPTTPQKITSSESQSTVSLNPQETPKKNFLHQNSNNVPEPVSSETSPSPMKKIDKSQIVLNEDTKNDLAPMAIKSSDSKKTALPDNLKLTEEQILDVLKKYKDSLEFTKLMEDSLSEYAKSALQSLLEPSQSKSVIKESMQGFQEGEKFKKQVDEEIHSQIKAYLQKELPLKMKSIIQEEIKKILSS